MFLGSFDAQHSWKYVFTSCWLKGGVSGTAAFHAFLNFSQNAIVASYPLSIEPTVEFEKNDIKDSFHFPASPRKTVLAHCATFTATAIAKTTLRIFIGSPKMPPRPRRGVGLGL